LFSSRDRVLFYFMLNNQKSDASAIQVFNSPQFGEIRTAGTSEDPLFCLSDVCSVLGLRQGDVKQRLDDGVVSTQPIIDTLGREQQANFVNEDGLYDVILDSRKPQAKAFRKWVTSEVLPAIRKTGGYLATKPDDTPEEIMARALTIAQATLAKREERLKQLEAQAEQQQATIEIQTEEIKKSAPKVSYYDNHLQSVNTQTSTQAAKQIGMDAEKLHKKLKEIGIIYRQSGQWILHAPYSTWGMHSTRTQTYTRSDGSTGTSVYTVWTTKGVRFIIALYENDWNVKKAIKQIKGELNPAA
jgi:prophage antirepressor-like protein